MAQSKKGAKAPSIKVDSELAQVVAACAAGETVKEQFGKAREALGHWFENLAIQFKDAPTGAPLNKREKFSVPQFDAAMREAESALLKLEPEGFVLPACWTQYKSDIRRAIGSGVARELYAQGAKSKRLGIFKLKSYMLDKAAESKLAVDPWAATLAKLAETASTLKSALHLAKDTPAGHAAKVRAVRKMAQSRIDKFATECAAMLAELQGKAKPDVTTKGDAATEKAAA